MGNTRPEAVVLMSHFLALDSCGTIITQTQGWGMRCHE
jgi:hypothetical protein